MQVLCEREAPGSDAVWRVRLGSGPGPASETLIDEGGVKELLCILAQAEQSVACRVLLLEGTPGSFCQGMDLAWAMGQESDRVEAAVRQFARCLHGLQQSSKVTIAAVDGSAAGGGVGLAAAADLVLATARATFSLPELSLGLLPAVVLPVLLARLGPARARLLALGGPVQADEALRLGLVDRLAADDRDLEQALRAALKQALRLRPESVAGLKELCGQVLALQRGLAMGEGAAMQPGAALELGATRTAGLLLDPDTRAALRAFLDGEPLPWFARLGARGSTRP